MIARAAFTRQDRAFPWTRVELLGRYARETLNGLHMLKTSASVRDVDDMAIVQERHVVRIRFDATKN